MKLKIDIACKPLVRAYLQYNYGKQIVINKETHIGKFFFKLLQKGPEYRRDTEYTAYSDKVSLNINEDLYLRNGFGISKSGLVEFNNYITDCVYGLLVLHIEMHEELMKGKWKIKQAIESFCNKYNFNDSDLSYETAKKYYYRSRIKKNALSIKDIKTFGRNVPDNSGQRIGLKPLIN